MKVYPQLQRSPWWIAAIAFMILLSGCAWMQKDRPQSPLIDSKQLQLDADIHLARGGWPAARWWTRYDDPQLNALMARALADSPSIKAARTRVEQARAAVKLAHAASRPKIIALGAGNKQWTKTSGDVGPVSVANPLPGISGLGATHSGRLLAGGILGSYSIDVWGKHKTAIDAAVHAKNAQRAQQAGAELEITTALAQTYFGLQTAYEQIDLLGQIQAILTDVVDSIRARKKRGLVTQSNVDQARQQLIQTKQLLASARTQAANLKTALRLLVGAHGGDFPDIRAVKLPQPRSTLPAQLSYSLLSHRPDLVALRWYVQSSLDQVTLAKDAFYPSFNIKAFLGISNIHLGDVVNLTTRQASILPGVTLPIFMGGALNANLARTRAGSNLLIEQYNQAVLGAVRDVAVAATNVQGLERQAALGQEKRAAIQSTTDQARASATRGLISRVTARKAAVPLLEQKAKLAENHGQQLIAEIALIKALGGGYDITDNQLPHSKSATTHASEKTAN